MFKKLNIISNILIVALVIGAIVWMFFSVNNVENKLIASGIEAFKFFTVDSNALMGIASLLSLIFILNKKESLFISVFKYVATASVTLTFLTVMFYLGPVFGMLSMLEGPNSLMHLVIPVIAIAHLFFLEPKAQEYKKRYIFYSAIPMVAYGIIYLSNLAANNGYGNVKYDWYFFGAFGIGIGFLMYLGMIGFSLLIGLGLYYGWKKININKRASE